LASDTLRRRVIQAILLGGLAAGVLDIADAIIFTLIRGGSPPRMLQGIASGLLGQSAFQGGSATAALGLFLHFVIATGAAAVYVAASLRVPALLDRPLVWGPVYGLIVYAVMRFVILPLSLIRMQPLSLNIGFANLIFAHIFLVGIPIVYIASRILRGSRTASGGNMRTAAVTVLFACAMTAGAAEPVPYPDGFREWVLVKSAIVTAGHPAFKTEGGLHHIYANTPAVEGYRTGTFADGASIAYELLEIREADGLVSEGMRKRVDVMLRDSGRYASTGGWGFERWYGNDRTERAVRDGGDSCFRCHEKRKDQGFVFSRIRE
jgi:hypothetical protein